MNKWWVRTGMVGLVVVLLAGAAGSALAQGPDDAMVGARTGIGMALIQAVADATGLSVDEIRADLRDGRALADICQEQDVDPQTVIDTVKTDLTAQIEQSLADGKITQAQADRRLDRLDNVLEIAMYAWMPLGMHADGLWRARLRADSALVQALADEAGILPRQLVRELAGHTTLADVAQAHGVDLNTVISTAEATLTDQINQAVTDGDLTQAQADALIARLPDFLEQQAHRDFGRHARGGRTI